MAWPEKTKVLPLVSTPRKIAALATLTPKVKLSRPYPPLVRAVWGPTATEEGEEKAEGGGEGDNFLEPRGALAVFDAPAPTLVISSEDLGVTPGLATFDGPTPKVFTGPMLSPTDRRTGFGLPHPSVLVVADRLGPARLTAAEREILGVDE